MGGLAVEAVDIPTWMAARDMVGPMRVRLRPFMAQLYRVLGASYFALRTSCLTSL